MKFTFWILSAYSISLLSCVVVNAQPVAKNLTNEVDNCPKDNSFPVCGTNGVENLLFGNECLLKQAGHKHGDFTKTTLKACFKDCELICLGFYDPICAIDPISNATRTFNNKCEIVKDSCKSEIDWKLKKQGKCTRTLKKVKKLKKIKAKASAKKFKKRKLKPIPCPKIFNPVCAIYTGVKSTFVNECLVNAENVKTGKDWRIFSQGICEEDYSSVSKSPKRHNIRKRSLDLKDFGNFENAFELGEPVTYIRPPPIFHTHFIKNDDTEGILNREQSNIRSIYEDQSETSPVLLGKSENMFLHQFLKNANQQTSFSNVAESHHLPSQIGTSNFGILQNPYNYEPPKIHYQQQQTKFHDQYLPAIEPTNIMPIFDQSHFNAETCKLGTAQLCCSFQDKQRTFKNICDLNLHNELTGEDWQLEHEGTCKDCNFMCSKIFKPLCVSMNGLQYTIRNECVFNAAMCKHRERAWKVIKSGICDDNIEKNYQNVKDKYETVAPGFRYTSNYRTTSTESVPTITPNDIVEQTTQNVPLKKNSQRPQKPKSFKSKMLLIKQKTSVQHENRENSDIKVDSVTSKALETPLNINKSSENATNEYIFVVKPLQEKPILYTTTVKPAEDPEELEEISKDATTPQQEITSSSKILQANKELIQEVLDDFKTKYKGSPFKQQSLKETTNKVFRDETRLSMYGPHENSVMTAVIKALNGTSKVEKPSPK